jgi:glycosyltransferase involved in cell wall biosynthesis
MSRGGTVLAHDSVTAYGGGERTLEALLPLFPQAPLFTAVFKPPVTLAHLGHRRVHASFLQRAPLPTRLLKPLFPLAFASLRAPAGTELILSSSSGYAKGLRHPGAVHVSYVHTPIRRVWNTYHRAAQRRPRGVLRAAEALSLRLLQRWDLASMRRVDQVVANSQNTARQIQRIYGRTAMVVPPPVRTSFFVPGDRAPGGDYLLTVARLDPYKRIDLAITACRALGLRLVVVGDGVERTRLSAGADRQVTFLGVVDDATLRSLYQGCRALVFPGEEDFGIAPVEAQACGRPVVAFAAGGALETVVDGETGVLFETQTVEGVVAALQRLDRLSFDPARIRQHAVTFDEAAFQRRMDAVVKAAAPGPREPAWR